LIANAFFLPHHLLNPPDAAPAETPKATTATAAEPVPASDTKP
jgi:hypothetical protein